MGDMAALALVPQSVFAPLSALTMCLNAVISPWLLGENLANADAVATALVVVGAGLTTMFGDHQKQDFTLQQMLGNFQNDEVIAYQMVLWLCFCLCVVALKTKFCYKMVNSKETRIGPLRYGMVAGMAG